MNVGKSFTLAWEAVCIVLTKSIRTKPSKDIAIKNQDIKTFKDIKSMVPISYFSALVKSVQRFVRQNQ